MSFLHCATELLVEKKYKILESMRTAVTSYYLVIKEKSLAEDVVFLTGYLGSFFTGKRTKKYYNNPGVVTQNNYHILY